MEIGIVQKSSPPQTANQRVLSSDMQIYMHDACMKIQYVKSKLIHWVACESSQYILIQKDVWEPLPLAIYGSMALISALLVLVLPETLGESLPDTVDDTCNLGKNR